MQMFSITCMTDDQRFILAFALMAVLPSGAAQAAGHCALAADLEARVAERLGYPPGSDCPEVQFALPEGTGLQRSQAGAFDPVTGGIDLDPSLDLTSVLGQSYLLHELVHAGQYRAGRHLQVACPAALEAEAYSEQADFLMEAGLQREAILTRAIAAQMGGCEDPQY